MATINAPLTATNILINTLLQRKVVFLPAASTVGAGKLYFIKDICGNAARSTVTISTVGIDTVESRNIASTTSALLNSNFQSVLLASDGLLNWMILQNYNTNVISRPATFFYFSNPVFRLATVPVGSVFSNAAGTTLSVPTGTVQLWRDTGNTFNFGLGTAPTYQTIGGINAVYFFPNQFLSASGSAINNLATYTYETTVFLVRTTGVFSAKQRNTVNTYNYFYYQAGTVRFSAFNGSTQGSSTAGALATGRWYYIVLTYDGTGMRVYINGTLNNTTLGTNGAMSNDTVPANTLGAGTGDINVFSDMYMAEFNVYSSAASATSINQSYLSRKAYYGLD